VKVGIVSDVHGNAAGLREGLAAMGELDMLLCAGDIVEEHRFCNDTVATLRDAGAVCVLGNHDLGILSGHGERARSAPHVDRDLVAWLADRPLSIEIMCGSRRLMMTHASPFPPHNQYVLPGTPDFARLAGVDADFLVLGHTHRAVAKRSGSVMVINPGSVGQGRDPSRSHRLTCAVLETDTAEVAFHEFDDPRHLVASEGAST
jgi:putative phosphoesterase